MIEGYEEKKIDSYRQTRMLMFTMVRLMGDSQKGPKTLSELWELPGDEVERITQEDKEALLERFARLPKLK